jgi:hypothetical protein
MRGAEADGREEIFALALNFGWQKDWRQKTDEAVLTIFPPTIFLPIKEAGLLGSLFFGQLDGEVVVDAAFEFPLVFELHEVVHVEGEEGAIGGFEVEVDVVVGGLIDGGIFVHVEIDGEEGEGGEIAEVLGEELAEAGGTLSGVLHFLGAVFDLVLGFFGEVFSGEGFPLAGGFGGFGGLSGFGEYFGLVPAGEESGVIGTLDGCDEAFGEFLHLGRHRSVFGSLGVCGGEDESDEKE